MDDFVFVDDNSVGKNTVMEEVVKMTSMEVETVVRNRYAVTSVRVVYENLGEKAAETIWSLSLPSQAFISSFVLEADGKEHKAKVAERAEARKDYEGAIARGQGAAHVATDARDANSFSTAVHVKPKSHAILTLHYEELLTRTRGRYLLRLHLIVDRLVPQLQVIVRIQETRSLKDIHVTHDNYVTINRESESAAQITFKPTIEEQKIMAAKPGAEGTKGQFDLEYDVERDPSGGEVLINDGYFVHFFAPSELKPIPKHVVFVLDVSSSMCGRKIEQLKEAMKSILSELNSEDYFNIVKFDNDVQILYSKNLTNKDANTSLAATEENVKKAQKIVETMQPNGCTNICDALITALSLTLKGIVTSEPTKHKHQPIIVFLTDGQANVGVSDPSEIIKIVNQRNDNENKAAIFSLAFGHDANKDFLKELALKNSGFSRTIYEASDASLQLQNFYKQISSPLLTNIKFKYSEKVKELTKHNFDILFNGSEFVVTGKADDVVDGFVIVEGSSLYGIDDFRPTIIPVRPKKKDEEYGHLERLWAYMTIKQLLDKKYEKKENQINAESPEKQALKLALQYSFVTPITSLVVVLPDQKEETDLQWGDVHVARPDTQISNFRYIKQRGGGGALFGAPQLQCYSSPATNQMRSCASQRVCFGAPQSMGLCPPQGVCFGSPQSMGPDGNQFQANLRCYTLGTDDDDVSETDSVLGECSGFDGDIGFTSVDTSSLPTPPPKLNSLKIITNVQDYHSQTVVTYKFTNIDAKSREVAYTVEIPQHANITGFAIEVNGKKFEAQKEKTDKASIDFQQNVLKNLTTGRITKAQEDRKYDITINIDARNDAIIYLTYEENLRKNNDIYQLITNLNPGNIVDDLEVTVNINDSKPIHNVGIPFFKSKVGITECEHAIVNFDNGSVNINFKPNSDQQIQIIDKMKEDKNKGIIGQLVIEFKTETEAGEKNEKIPDILADGDLVAVSKIMFN